MLCYVRRRNDLQYEQAETPGISACASRRGLRNPQYGRFKKQRVYHIGYRRTDGECPDFAEDIEDILIDMDYKDFAEDYWEEFDDGYDPDAYFDDD